MMFSIFLVVCRGGSLLGIYLEHIPIWWRSLIDIAEMWLVVMILDWWLLGT